MSIQKKVVEPLLSWLSACQVAEAGYDRGGIFDPLDGRVMGEHYSTTHFAWACALKAHNGESPWFNRAKQAIEFHIRTSPDQYAKGNWDYHWDFNNLAFAETYSLLAPYLDLDEKARWCRHLVQWKANTHLTINWVAMRALALFRRSCLLDRPEDLTLAKKYLARVLKAQTRDGCLDDLPGISRPSQYHAYTACLLFRMKALDPTGITRACIRAARWLLAICSPDGDTTHLGRGQGQVFGHVCGAYLFRKAQHLDPGFAGQYLRAEQLILDRLAQSQARKGWLPLVLSSGSLENRWGWYDYHHLTVYNAFAAVWLSLALHEDIGSEKEVTSGSFPLGPTPPTLFRHSGIFSWRTPGFSLVCAAGETGGGYSADAGITPHCLYWQEQVLFRYPIGPGPGKYGTKERGARQAENIWAPMVRQGRQWIAPFGGKGKIRAANGRGCTMTYTRQHISWQRKLSVCGHTLELSDCLDISRAWGPVKEIRVVTIALRKGMVTRQAGCRLFLDKIGLVISTWGQGNHLVHKGEAIGADGPVDIFAIQVCQGDQTRFTSGIRIRPQPCPGRTRPVPAIVCMSWDPWSELWKRKQRLLFDMAGTSQGPEVIYADPPVSITAAVEDLGSLIKNTREGARYRRALSGRMTQMKKGFLLTTPLFPLPGSRSYPAIARANRFFCRPAA